MSIAATRGDLSRIVALPRRTGTARARHDRRGAGQARTTIARKMLMVVAISAVGANDAARAAAENSIELKDGPTVYIFKDGKMAMEDEFSRATRMDQGTVVESRDGPKIAMHGDEVMRLKSLLKWGYGGGSR